MKRTVLYTSFTILSKRDGKNTKTASMKTLYLSLLLTLLIISCESQLESLDETTELMVQSSSSVDATYDANSLVVHYQPGLSLAERERIRSANDIDSFESCECGDRDLELWNFDGTTTSAEGRKDKAEGDLGDDGVDYNFNIQKPEFLSIGLSENRVSDMKQRLSRKGPVLAVLDSGLDYDHVAFPNKYLAPNRIENCLDGISGWDFVNDDNNPDDDYGHGTFVSGVAIDALVKANEDFRIMPIKVLNKSGTGRLFDALCGFRYAQLHGAEVINMSFGWYGSNSAIFDKFIKEAQESLVVVSAGNEMNNNDDLAHRPFNPNADNNIAVAAVDEREKELAEYSNYGYETVGIAAVGTKIRSTIPGDEWVIDSGTSYAAPHVAAGGIRMINSGSNIGGKLIQCIKDNSVYLNELQQLVSSSKYYDAHRPLTVPCN